MEELGEEWLCVTYSGQWCAARVDAVMLQWLTETHPDLAKKWRTVVVAEMSSPEQQEMAIANEYFKHCKKPIARSSFVFIWGLTGTRQALHADCEVNNKLVSLIALQDNATTQILTHGPNRLQYDYSYRHTAATKFSCEDINEVDERGKVASVDVAEEMQRVHAPILRSTRAADNEKHVAAVATGNGLLPDGRTRERASILMPGAVQHAGEASTVPKSWCLSILSPFSGLVEDEQFFHLRLYEKLYGRLSKEAVQAYTIWYDGFDNAEGKDDELAERCVEINLDDHLDPDSKDMYRVEMEKVKNNKK
jgi:hypothetical protein